jgi:hypothetical protein
VELRGVVSAVSGCSVFLTGESTVISSILGNEFSLAAAGHRRDCDVLPLHFCDLIDQQI